MFSSFSNSRVISRSYAWLGSLLQSQGRLNEALPVLRKVADARIRVQGVDHPSTANALNNLAVLLRDQGNKLEARKIGKQAYATALKSLGKDHPDTIRYKYWEMF